MDQNCWSRRRPRVVGAGQLGSARTRPGAAQRRARTGHRPAATLQRWSAWRSTPTSRCAGPTRRWSTERATSCSRPISCACCWPATAPGAAPFMRCCATPISPSNYYNLAHLRCSASATWRSTSAAISTSCAERGLARARGWARGDPDPSRCAANRASRRWCGRPRRPRRPSAARSLTGVAAPTDGGHP